MAEHAYLYRQGPDDARRNGELDLYRESNLKNSFCAEKIDAAIDKHWDGMHLDSAAAEGIVAEFGYDRVRWVLAATMQAADWDQRYSGPNREWLKDVWIPPEVDKGMFIPHAHPVKLNDFASLTRTAYEQLNLFHGQQCVSVRDFETVAGQVLVLKPEMLKDEYKTPECQLFLAKHGFGCSPTASGRAIFGEFLIDGEKARYWRQDFLGVLKPELLPAWAMEKLAAPEPAPEAVRIKVFQINPAYDPEQRRFQGLKPGRKVDSSIYVEVYDGQVYTKDLDAIYSQFNTNPPQQHRGWSMSVSDVIEIDGAYHFVNRAGFTQIDFDASLAQLAVPEDAGMEEAPGGMGMKFHGT